MYGLFGFGNIKADIVLIAVLSVVLIIVLIYNYWQKKLDEKLRCSNDSYRVDTADEKSIPHKELPAERRHITKRKE